MKRRGCIDCRLIEPTAGQWIGGRCPRCAELHTAKTEQRPQPDKPPARDATADRLRGYLARIAQQYPECWKLIDRLRAERGRAFPNWPGWCFIPLSGPFAIVSGGMSEPPSEKYADVGVLGCLAAWRPTQGIYRYDETLRESVWDTPLDGEVPAEILHNMPEWCVYVETPGAEYLAAPSQGFFAFLEQDSKDSREELRIVIDCEPHLHVAVPIHLNRGGLLAGVESALDEAVKQINQFNINASDESRKIMSLPRDMIANSLRPRINLLLYLCSANAEMQDRKGRRRASRPMLTKTKDGIRMFPAERPEQWNVGFRLGAAIRRAQEAEYSKPGDGTHASPRPHIRRAHWHSFWTGPKASATVRGDRQIVLKWLPPIPVNVDEEYGPVPTIHPVRGDG